MVLCHAALIPGELQIEDHYQSSARGRRWESMGRTEIEQDKFKRRTLFYDANSILILCHHHFSLRAGDTLKRESRNERTFLNQLE